MRYVLDERWPLYGASIVLSPLSHRDRAGGAEEARADDKDIKVGNGLFLPGRGAGISSIAAGLDAGVRLEPTDELMGELSQPHMLRSETPLI